MEIWRARALRAILFYPLSPYNKTSLCSFQTLARPPPPSSFPLLRRCLFVSPPPRHQLFLFPRVPLAARTLSSLSSGPELEWREDQQHTPVSCSEDEGYQDHLLEVQQEKQSRFIPVKAYFLCTGIDLKSLQAQNAFNVIPPTSRATNYVVLRYYDIKAEPHVSFCESFHFIYFMRVNYLLILSKIQLSNRWH
ncbi:hypothetical protein DsansV1_C01g0002901 [Dioscorea sansibarensis]